ncbi:DUF4382 domain-containing protein [Ferrimonas balearica]|uniref:DUF4382 domain-containing protein n=1 Tax=Ferrimonas balearica TaxID=44012 RepID=UPI001C99FC88|nr:DUF4382 domain-containing protein [Ferrimonas balearica]MBY5992149.1 DUF4382 domain-containing protein [Ferrimonas balearica]
MKLQKTLVAASLIGLLAACGSDGSSEEPARLTLGVSDNPADANEVVIAFKEVGLKRVSDDGDVEEGEVEHFIGVDNDDESSEWRQIDLLDYQGSDTALLFEDQGELTAGDYKMCIYIQDGDGSRESSYVATDDMDYGLKSNSNGACAGFKPDDGDDTGRLFVNKQFTLNPGDNFLVLEMDLMKVLQPPRGSSDDWTLKPTGYELVHVEGVGNLRGSVDTDSVRLACEVAVAGSTFAEAVYLYPADTTLEQMGDFRDGEQEEGKVAPLGASRVTEGEEELAGTYFYEFGFLDEGNYSLGYTCTAHNDDPQAPNGDQDVEGPFFLSFASPENAEVVAGTTSTYDLIDTPEE